jgi:hypothetical protein
MAKPAITKRVTKGSALTYSELDTNFQNLTDATVTLTAGSGGTAVSSDLNGNITLVAGTGVTLTGNNTAKTITIASAGAGTVNTGASGALTFYPSPGGAVVDDTLITYSQSVGLQTLTATNALTLAANGATTLSGTGTTDITGNGLVTITPGTNNSISLNTSGTGAVSIGGLGALSAASVSNGGSGVRIDGGGTVGITNASDTDIYITPVGTGKLIIQNDINIGKTTAGVTVMSNWNNNSTFILLKNRNASGVGQLTVGNNDIELQAGTGTHTGSIILKTGGSGRSVAVGDGTNQALITSAIPLVGTSDLKVAAGTGGAILLGATTNSNITITPNGTGSVVAKSDTLVLGALTDPETVITTDGATDLLLDTNDGTDSGTITITAGADSNITITPDGTGKTVIGNLVATETIVANGNTGAATLTPNAASGAVQSYTVTGNITLNAFGTPVAGQSITLILTQDGTGSRLLTSTMKFAGGSKTLSTAANAVDIITVYYDGTTYWASLSKGFA